MSELNARYAHYEIEPFGFEVENYRMGQICSVISAVHGGKSKPSDFYPALGEKADAAQSDEELASGLLQMFRNMSHTE